MSLLDPKEITLKTQEGTEKTYTLSKFPAVAGREIIAKYPTNLMPKVGDYAVSEETMLKLMAFVAVQNGENVLKLNTRALVDNHVPDWETLAKIEMAMMEYNCSFFGKGANSIFSGGFAQLVKSLTTKMSMVLSEQLSEKEKPASTN